MNQGFMCFYKYQNVYIKKSKSRVKIKKTLQITKYQICSTDIIDSDLFYMTDLKLLSYSTQIEIAMVEQGKTR